MIRYRLPSYLQPGRGLLLFHYKPVSYTHLDVYKRQPKILHLHTIKGKGFGPAEKHATEWHAPGKFDPVTGERFIANTEGMPPLFQDVFGNTLVELAEANPKIVGVTPAMPSGCSMNILMEKMPKRAFDVGIAEGHAVTFSGGMAKDGLQPFCNIYSSFMQRAHDNICLLYTSRCV